MAAGNVAELRLEVMAKTSTHRVLVFRSGATEWDALDRVQGATDLPMSAGGMTTVQTNLAELASHTLDVILTAPDEASRHTAKLLAEATGARKVTAVGDLADMALGLWEGLRYEELESRFCRAGRLFLDDPSGVLAPEGEQLDAYSAKVVAGLGRGIARQKVGATIGVVLRPLALGVVRCSLNDAPICELWQMIRERPDHEWYVIDRNDSRLNAPPRRPRRPASAA